MNNHRFDKCSDDSALRALSSLKGLRGASEVPPLCRETQSLGQHMLELSCENTTVGKNGLNDYGPVSVCMKYVSYIRYLTTYFIRVCK